MGQVPYQGAVEKLSLGARLGWQRALAKGEIGIQGPGNITTNGLDFLTYDPEADLIKVYDARYSKTGSYPKTLSAAKLASWKTEIASAVGSYTGPYSTEIQNALANNQVKGFIFGYDMRVGGWSAP